MSTIKIGCLNCRGLASDHIKRRDIFENIEINMILLFLSILTVHQKSNNLGSMSGAIKHFLTPTRAVAGVLLLC